MKYMVLIYNRPGFVEDLTDTERTEVFGEVDAIVKELTESGELVSTAALADPSITRTVRVREGVRWRSEGSSEAGCAPGPSQEPHREIRPLQGTKS